MAPDLVACASGSTVVGTVASASFGRALAALADSAFAVGFGCVAVQAMDWFDELRHARVRSLPAPEKPLRPHAAWCTERTYAYAKRLTQLHKALMLRAILSAGHSLLAVDCDWRLRYNPLPYLLEMRPPMDVVALHDGAAHKQLNIGLMWVRLSTTALAWLRAVENRTAGSWDQLVLNEEINFNPEFAGLACCHTNALLCAFEHSNDVRSTNETRGRRASLRRECHASRHAPLAMAPPNGTRMAWTQPWQARGFNELHISRRRVGRCTEVNAACRAWTGPLGPIAQSRAAPTVPAAVRLRCAMPYGGPPTAPPVASRPRVLVVAHYKSGYLASFQLLASVCCTTPFDLSSSHAASVAWLRCRRQCPQVGRAHSTRLSPLTSAYCHAPSAPREIINAFACTRARPNAPVNAFARTRTRHSTPCSLPSSTQVQRIEHSMNLPSGESPRTRGAPKPAPLSTPSIAAHGAPATGSADAPTHPGAPPAAGVPPRAAGGVQPPAVAPVVVHFLRHPLDMLISGTRYAMRCAETWMRAWPPRNSSHAVLAWGEDFLPRRLWSRLLAAQGDTRQRSYCLTLATLARREGVAQALALEAERSIISGQGIGAMLRDLESLAHAHPPRVQSSAEMAERGQRRGPGEQRRESGAKRRGESGAEWRGESDAKWRGEGGAKWRGEIGADQRVESGADRAQRADRRETVVHIVCTSARTPQLTVPPAVAESLAAAAGVPPSLLHPPSPREVERSHARHATSAHERGGALPSRAPPPLLGNLTTAKQLVAVARNVLAAFIPHGTDFLEGFPCPSEWDGADGAEDIAASTARATSPTAADAAAAPAARPRRGPRPMAPHSNARRSG